MTDSSSLLVGLTFPLSLLSMPFNIFKDGRIHLFQTSAEPASQAVVAVVLPCFNVRKHILSVLEKILPEVDYIVVVDDHCPQKTGEYVKQYCDDSRLHVIYHDTNKGVGGAVMSGYKAAIELGADIVVKIDGDGQMPPEILPTFVEPILLGNADYTKGNRFFDLEKLMSMPKSRIFGNAVLSFMAKFSSGYWNTFDPTNGYTAIHTKVLKRLPFDKISDDYFFETDMLFRLNTLRAVVIDVPMDASYADEQSNLKIHRVIGSFFWKHLRNTAKRVFYNYYLRNVSYASIELPIGLVLILFGLIFGSFHWGVATFSDQSNDAGTVMLSALPIIIGLQLLLAFLAYDIASVPQAALHQRLGS